MRTTYHCETCGNRSENKKEIEACEARGVATDLPPRGLLVSLTYRAAEDAPFVAGVDSLKKLGHGYEVLCAWFRGNGCGDDENPFGGNGRPDVLRLDGWRERDDTEKCAALVRAVAAAIRAGVTPTVLRHGQPVPVWIPFPDIHQQALGLNKKIELELAEERLGA